MDTHSMDVNADDLPEGADDTADGQQTAPQNGCQDASQPSAEASVSAEELADLRTRAAERDQLRDRMLRSQADFENWRKRIKRETAAKCRFAIQEFIQELLPVLDNFDRAIEHEQADDAEAFVDGVRLIQKQFYDVLRAYGVQPIETVGRKFDPEAHEAVAMLPSPEQEPFTVIEDVRRGFRMHDRVIRAAQVVVAAGPQSDDGDEQRDRKPVPEET